MRIKIPHKQHCLEERDRDRPDRGRSAESRQNHLGKHRLDPEQERRRKKQRYREDQLYRFAVQDRVAQWSLRGIGSRPSRHEREFARQPSQRTYTRFMPVNTQPPTLFALLAKLEPSAWLPPAVSATVIRARRCLADFVCLIWTIRRRHRAVNRSFGLPSVASGSASVVRR